MTRRRSQSRRLALKLFLHSSGTMFGGLVVRAVIVPRRPYAQKELKCVAELIAVVAIEAVWAIVNRKLSAESDINAVAVGQIADIANRITAYQRA